MAETRTAQRKEFLSRTPEEKKIQLASLLSQCKAGNSDLEDVYEYVASEFSEESDYDEIFDAVMGVLEASDETSAESAKRRLENLRERLEAVLARERAERSQELAEAEATIGRMP